MAQDHEVVKAFIEFGDLPEDCDMEGFDRYLDDLVAYIQTKFPGISTEQFSRCHETTLADPDDDADQAAIAQAVIKALEASGAENLGELEDEAAQKLGAELEALAKKKISQN